MEHVPNVFGQPETVRLKPSYPAPDVDFTLTSNARMSTGMCVESSVMMCLSAEWGSTKTGEQEQLIVTALNCVLRVPRYIPQEQRFDVRVLVKMPSVSANGTT